MSAKSKDLKSGLNLAKVVKPTDGEYRISISGGSIAIISSDKRRYLCAFLTTRMGDGITEDFLLPQDRSSIFEADLDDVDLSINEKGLSLKYSGGGTKKSAVIKRRSPSKKGVLGKSIIIDEEEWRIESNLLDELLTVASASALVHETKTEEDMKMNQIIFDSKNNCIISNARYYATFVFHPSIKKDISIISADIPTIRAFCNRCKGDILISCDNVGLCFKHQETGSYLIINKINSKQSKNPSVPDVRESIINIQCSTALFKDAIKWSGVTLEGTQRISIQSENDGDSEVLKFSQSDRVLTSIPILSSGNTSFSADLPLKVLDNISCYLLDGNVVIRHGLKAFPDVVMFEQTLEDLKVQHFVRSMRSK